MKTKKVKTQTLIIWLAIGFIFSIFIGITGISMGLGSIYPQLNMIAKPFVCSGQQMSYAQNVTEIGSDTYYSAIWSCVDEESNEVSEIKSNTVFSVAGTFYGLILFALLFAITYFYWYSSIGPAKNDGLHLW